MRLLNIGDGSGAYRFQRDISLLKDYTVRSKHFLNWARSSSKLEKLIQTLVQKLNTEAGRLVLGTPPKEVVKDIGNCRDLGFASHEIRQQYLSKGNSCYRIDQYFQPIMVNDQMAGYLVIGIGKEDCNSLVRELIDAYAAMITQEYHLAEKGRSVEVFSSKFMKKKKELEKVQQYNHSLLSMTTHDLSSPLNAVAGYLDLIEDGLANGDSTSKILRYQSRVRSGIEDISGMLMQLGEIGRFEKGLEKLEYVTMELGWTVTRVAELLRKKAEDKHISLSVTQEESPVYVQVDSTKLKRIIYNLICNAIKYTPEEGSITISIGTKNGSSYVKIADSGNGIPNSKLETIFEPYMKLEQDKQDPISCGLGLYISSYFAKLMQGKLSVQSELNKGSVFTLELPEAESFGCEKRQAG